MMTMLCLLVLVALTLPVPVLSAQEAGPQDPLIVVQAPLPGAVQLQWTAPTTNANGTPNTDLAGYKVYQGTTSRQYGAGVDVKNVTTYTVQNLQAGQTYYFAVTAYDTAKNESVKSNEVRVTTPPLDAQPPMAPPLALSTDPAGLMTLTWAAPSTDADGTPLTGLAGYKLYQGTDTAQYGDGLDLKNITSTPLPAMPGGETHYFAMTAYDPAGNESAKSNEVSAAIPLPQPPAPVALGTVNIRDYGAIPNDGQLDTVAIRNAAEAINNAGGGTVYFPPGLWDSAHLPFTTGEVNDAGAARITQPLKNVTFAGAGMDVTILKRRPHNNPAAQRRLMTVGRAENFTLMDMTLDMNNTRLYGGAGFYECLGCTVLRTKVTDTNPAPVTGDYPDRYALVFGFSNTLHRNIVIVDSVIEHLGLEIDNAEGVLVTGNTFRECVSTTCVGTFALYDTRTVRHFHFVNNTIIDPQKAGILVGWDRVVTDTRFEDIRILNNTIQYTKLVTGSAIRAGVGDNSQPTTGNSMQGVRIEGNRIVVADGLPTTHVQHIFVNNSPTANVLFEDMVVRHNRQHSAVPRPFVRVSAGPAASTTEVYDNTRVGVTETVHPLGIASVTASTFQTGFGPGNTIDGKLSTRWSAEGKGQEIIYALGQPRQVSRIDIAWYRGTERQSLFAIAVSPDGTTWTEVFRGISSGKTLNAQSVQFAAVAAQYVRITGYGNTVHGDWNSITEVAVYGTD